MRPGNDQGGPMRLRVDPDATQLEDRRGMRGGGVAIGGGVGVLGLIIAVLFNVLSGGGGGGFSIDPGLNQLPAQTQAQPLPSGLPADTPAQDALKVFTHVQKTWTGVFQAAGRTYEPTKLVLFENGVSTGCGPASSAVGPFYCPTDRKVYLDLGFFKELSTRFGAPGDFAQAYVIAHEVGHHIQVLLGVSDQVRAEQQRKPSAANDLSVRLELQADCFAGVWGHAAYTNGELDPGDVKEGLDAAESVGDDRLQKQAGGRVNPEEWTHGSSASRHTWFQKGFDGGDPKACDTFSGDV
jgi:predicted metalloprotease